MTDYIHTFTTFLRDTLVEVGVISSSELVPATFHEPAEGGEFEYHLHRSLDGKRLYWDLTADEDLAVYAEYQKHCEMWEIASYG